VPLLVQHLIKTNLVIQKKEELLQLGEFNNITADLLALE